MEFVFILNAIIITVSIIYLMGRTLYSHVQLMRAYRESDFLFIAHFIFGIGMMMTILTLLFALNNTVWHYPYLIL